MKKAKIYIVIVIIAIALLLTTTYQIKLQNQQTDPVLWSIVIATTILMCVLSVFIYREKKIDEMLAFKVVVPIIMLLFIIAMPIFRSHDEDAHWIRIYDISIGHFLTPTEYGEAFQEGATNFPASNLPKAIDTILEKSYTSSTTKEMFDVKLDNNERLLYAMPTTSIYSPIQYLPQALGVAMARIFTDRLIIMAYAARIMNILVSFTALYFAMKLMPFGKKILFVAMSIPIALEGLSSLSPDGMTISVSFLFIAYLLHLIFEKKEEPLTWKQTAAVTALGVVLALCKIVYLPIVGLVLLLPRTKFPSRKRQIIQIALMIGLAVIANLIWLSISSGYLATFKEGRPVSQLGTLLANPIEYLQTLMYTINLNGAKYFLSMLGGEVGLNEYVSLHSIVPFVFAILLLLATFSSKENKPKFSTYQMIIMALIVLAVVGLIFTSLYIQWTREESDSIMGVQGRYFIPILPIALLLLSNLNIKLEYSETTVTKWIIIGILMLQITIIPLVYCIRTVSI